MSDQEIIDTIAEWLQDNTRYGCTSDRLATDFLAALRERYAIVELPKPDDDTEWDGQDQGWWVSYHRAHEQAVGQRRVVPHLFRDSLHPNAARRLAAALLAAADAAEESK